ncbi:MAG: hypothetical protein WCT26_01800 [Candidatus Buchananbacteria bacterium]|jgi:hypothetical protein
MLILPSITTTHHAFWREKITEAKKLGLTEAALFVSAISLEERQELYARLKETKIKSIPFVHLRSDMELDEIQYLIDNYGVKAMNIHSKKEFPLAHNLTSLKDVIYMENTTEHIADEVPNWAGICFDVSHHESKRLKGEMFYDEIQDLLEKYPIGAWHLNSIKPQAIPSHHGKSITYSWHSFENLSELDYCVRYKKLLPQHVIALELENPLSEQLRAKDYVEKLLK